ncbi:36842_t:CDS:2 [Gigaspora margarita]|uniref:36842_t:CDS:1 n=1 Tax=Gigaspora margarita TaxID=4874 RepID=A0ABN7WE70_GIGMA|nr:36842_t:CDS:2 [Gigaspora margarita]
MATISLSQLFTYEECLVLSAVEVSCFDTVNDAFIEDVDDEPQMTIRHIGGLSHLENIVALLSDGTYLCTCMEMINKGIICHHFWHVMLYSIHAKFHISIIPTRWYKDILVAVKPRIETLSLPSEVISTFQNLQQFQKLEHNEIIHCTTPLRNRFGVAFSISKTAINIALETNSDKKLIRMLKNFIAIKRQGFEDSSCNINNSYDNTNEKTDESEEVVPLQQQFINQITDPNIVMICGAPSKKRLKSFTEVLGRRANDQETSNGEMS